jgi:hypothetical protein
MDTIFTLGDLPDGKIKINLDELYERKKKTDLNTLAIYNSILNRIHTKIKNSSRQNATEQFCWYIIPEMMIGVPRYDHASCAAYILHELKDNGFNVRYTHPNLLFISWKHWIPSYVRNEIKKKTGVIVDGYGNKVGNKNINDDPNNLILGLNMNYNINHMNNNNNNDNYNEDNIRAVKTREYKSIDTYKPSGLIYNQELLRKIEDKSKK